MRKNVLSPALNVEPARWSQTSVCMLPASAQGVKFKCYKQKLKETRKKEIK
jgi:hypothetical protein